MPTARNITIMIREKKIPLKRALIAILLSVVIVSGPFFLVWGMNHYMLSTRRANSAYNVVAIAQHCTSGEPLLTGQLAALLGITKEHNLFSLDFQALSKKLLDCPVIKEATVRPIVPSIVCVEYATRQPIAAVADIADAGIDAENVLFPLYPFFSKKRLPKIYLGMSSTDVEWGKLENAELRLAQEILSCNAVACIDVCNAFAASSGRREVVLTMDNGTLVRLNSDSWKKEAALFFTLLPRLPEQTGIFDMRHEGMILHSS